jgi:hypothetical protein
MEIQEYVTIIVSSVKAIKDIVSVSSELPKAYNKVKEYLKNKFPSVDIEQLEKNPNSESRHKVLCEELQDAQADKDQELRELLQKLLDHLHTHKNDSKSIGVDLRKIKVQKSLDIKDIDSSGDGVSINDAEIMENMNISGVKAGRQVESQKKS